MALDTSGFVPKGNLNTDDTALGAAGSKTTVKKVLKMIKRHRFFVCLSILFAFVNVVFTLLVPIMIGRAIDNIKDDSILYSYLMYAGIFAVIAGISQYVMNLINNRITYETVNDIRKQAIAKIQNLPLSYIDSHSQGDIVSRIVADADQFADGLLMGFSQLFTGVITIVGTLIFMLSMNVAITLVVVCMTPLSLFVAKFISKRTYSMFKAQSVQRGQLTSITDEMLGNIKVVKAFLREDEALKSFDEVNEELKGTSLKAIFFSSLTNPCTRFVNAICYALVALTGAWFALSGNSVITAGITVGTLTVFLSYANQYTKPFNEISSVISELQNAIACAARVFEVVEAVPESSDADNKVLPEAVGKVDIENVAFSYDKEKELIKDFNLKVSPGQRVAIVGPTGCGKTTLINLLMRFYDADSGSIRVDDTDIKDLTRESLRRNYGMVLQDTYLKAGTIKENIRLAKEDATDEEIIEAAKASHAHSFIRRLPKGYDTYIGEDGGMLSAGQKQLLCITRVMLLKPPMLILDEATSSIDTRTEIRIQKAFATLMEGRTSFIVAHRLSTIQSADIILVMKAGKIVEMGKHEDLLKKNGFYAELYHSM